MGWMRDFAWTARLVNCICWFLTLFLGCFGSEPDEDPPTAPPTPAVAKELLRDAPRAQLLWKTPQPVDGYAIVGDIDLDEQVEIVTVRKARDLEAGDVTLHTVGPRSVALRAELSLLSSAGQPVGRPSVARLGDVTGDGLADFAVGRVLRRGPTAVGLVEIFEGNHPAPPNEPSQFFELAVPVRASGLTLVGTGDVDGDDYADFVVSPVVPGARSRSWWRAMGGPAGVKVSTSAELMDGATLPGGGAAVTAGDLDGDGLQDVALGVPEDEGGRVMVHLGTLAGLRPNPDSLVVGGDQQGFGRDLLIVPEGGGGGLWVASATLKPGAIGGYVDVVQYVPGDDGYQRQGQSTVCRRTTGRPAIALFGFGGGPAALCIEDPGRVAAYDIAVKPPQLLFDLEAVGADVDVDTLGDLLALRVPDTPGGAATLHLFRLAGTGGPTP